MGKDNSDDILKLIDQLAARAVMLDMSSQKDLQLFIGELESLRACVAAIRQSLLPAFDIFISAVKESNSLEQINGVINFCFGDLRRIVEGGERQDLGLENIKNNIFVILGKARQGVSFGLTQVQKNELPDFISSASLLIDEIEKELLKLEKNANDPDALKAIFRGIHTLKGEAGFLGIRNLGNLAHELEALFERGRDDAYALNAQFIAYAITAIDMMRDILDLISKDVDKGLAFSVETLVAEIGLVTAQKHVSTADPAFRQTKSAAFKPKLPVIDLSEGSEIISEFIHEAYDHMSSAEESLLALEKSPDSDEHINKIFREFHTIKGLASFLNLDDIRTLGHDTETMMDLVRKGDLKLSSQITEIVLSAIDGMRKLLGLLNEQVSAGGVLKSEYYDISATISALREAIVLPMTVTPKDEKKKIGEILIEDGAITTTELCDALVLQKTQSPDKKIGELLVDMGVADPAQVTQGLKEQQKSVVVEDAVKIGVGKLDNLINMVGELVITGAQVSHHSDISGSVNARLINDMAQLGRIIRNIQDISMSMRLVPIRPLFQKMTRLIRDLSKKSNKEIELKMSGEDTEIDKNIVELLSDPFMHMVRNSIDHGIEDAQSRRSAGKPAVGSIQLNAYHKSGEIVIEVKDDGAGLNKEKIRKKAIEKGLLRQEDDCSEQKIYSLIFEPGFSTADKVSDISGRGVGMDVVKRNIEQLRGRIDISTEQGKGTTFVIKLPLTLAVIEGIILSVGQENYIVPIFSVVEFIKPKQEDITSVVDKGMLIKVHGNLYRVIQLSELFGCPSKYTDIEKMTGCLIESDYGRVCMLVDELIGQQQVVIKNLGEHLRNVKGLAGGTILGDGKVGLILDVNGIVGIGYQ